MDKQMPTADEISPTACVDLDERSAVENFLDKSLDEAEKLFAISALYYGGDLSWMGPKAFVYYFPAYYAYLKSPTSNGDEEAIDQLLCILEIRIGIRGEISLLPHFLDCIDYCLANINKFVTRNGRIEEALSVLYKWKILALSSNMRNT